MDSQFDLQEIIEYINPAELNYQDWVNVGMALQHEGYSVSVWDSWSARDTGRYHAGECERKWRTFHGTTTPVTGGTIVQMAREAGWVPDRGHELGWDDTISREEGVIIDKNWVEAQEIKEPENWDPKAELITYLETLFDSMYDHNIGYVIQIWSGRSSV